MLNTLVFLNDMTKGKPQYKLMETVKKLGVKIIEIRREFIKDFEYELKEINRLKKELDMDVYYSVPDIMFEKGILCEDRIQQFLKEAAIMGASKVKFNIGEFLGFNDCLTEKIKNIVNKQDILITVENDQTELNGKMMGNKKFLNQCKTLGIKIYYTFDVGNWYWVGEDPLSNALELKEFTNYIHLKDVIIEKSKPQPAYLNIGTIEWKKVLEQFPDNTPVALEYPCGDNPVKVLEVEIKKLLSI